MKHVVGHVYYIRISFLVSALRDSLFLRNFLNIVTV